MERADRAQRGAPALAPNRATFRLHLREVGILRRKRNFENRAEVFFYDTSWRIARQFLRMGLKYGSVDPVLGYSS